MARLLGVRGSEFREKLLLIGLLAATCLARTEAVTFSIDSQNVAPGNSIDLSVRVSDFAGITTVQFSVEWNPNVLEFQEVGDFGLPGMTAENFGVFSPSGKLSVSWDEPNGGATTLEDGARAFRVRLKAIADVGQSSIVAFSDQPTPAEASIELTPTAVEFVSSIVSIAQEKNPPQIVEYTPDLTVPLGAPVRIAVSATGTAPLEYAWFRGDVAIDDAVTAVLEIPSVAVADRGAYRVRVSNSFGSATSPQAILNVIEPKPDNVGDVDGDGKTDVLFMSNDGDLSVWLMDGAKVISRAPLDPRTVNGSRFEMVGTGDLDRDGGLDLVFQHTDGTLAGWMMAGLGLREAAMFEPPHPGDALWRVVALADFDADRRTDLLFQHHDGSLGVWFLEGLQLKSSALLSPSRVDDPLWRVAGTGDFDGDSGHDLLFQHQDGTMAVWLLDNLQLRKATLLNPAHPGAAEWKVKSTGDWNGDGRVDILFQNSSDGAAGLWFMNGTDLIDASLLSTNPGVGQRVTGP